AGDLGRQAHAALAGCVRLFDVGDDQKRDQARQWQRQAQRAHGVRQQGAQRARKTDQRESADAAETGLGFSLRLALALKADQRADRAGHAKTQRDILRVKLHAWLIVFCANDGLASWPWAGFCSGLKFDASSGVCAAASGFAGCIAAPAISTWSAPPRRFLT